MTVPMSVARMLFFQITDEITSLEKKIDNNVEFTFYERDKMKEIEEAIRWYKENCILSSSHLIQKWESFKEKYNKGGVKHV